MTTRINEKQRSGSKSSDESAMNSQRASQRNTEAPKDSQLANDAASDDASKASNKPPPPPEDFKQVAIVVPAALLVVFIVALDRSIVSTAIPRITDEFHSLDDIGWYGSAYLLTASCFQLLAGRIYTFYTPKYVFMVFIALLEVGSVVCGSAPSSFALIVGRAIAGLGCAGIQNGGIAIVLPLIPLTKRPIFQGFFGAMLGVGNVVGPLIGGAFTSDVSWRWCFYLNLPIGGLALLVILFAVQPKPPMQLGLTATQKVQQLDLLGELFLIPSLVCLLLALQWGGSIYPWNNGRIIALLVVFGASFIAFVLVQIFMQKTATIPGRVVRNRSIISAMWLAICNGAISTTVIYYVPVWFQAIKGNSAKTSGVHLTPMVLAITVASLFAGFLTKKSGYYTPFAIAGSVLTSVGVGMISTWKVDTGMGMWIGYQVIFGFGLGLGLQQPNLTAQTVLQGKDVQIGVSLSLLTQLLGGAIFVSVAQNVLDTSLVNGIKTVVKGGITPYEVVNSGATQLRNIFPKVDLPEVLVTYDKALHNVFVVCTCMACLSFLGAVTLEWRSVKGNQGPTTKKPREEEAGVQKGDA